MKRLAFIIICILSTLVANAQSHHGMSEIQSDSIRRVRYKQVVKDIFKEDELFVLFYLNLALVVDPARTTLDYLLLYELTCRTILLFPSAANTGHLLFLLTV